MTVVVDTRQQVVDVSTLIRERLVGAGLVDNLHVVTTRRNDPHRGVANRDTWTVIDVDRHGQMTVHGEQGSRVLPARHVDQHVELGYASTAHGAQGATSASAHSYLGS